MSSHALILLGIFLTVLLLTVRPMGLYIARVMEGRFSLGGKIERPLYRLCGIKQDEEMGWLKYAFAILLFNVIGVLACAENSSFMRSIACMEMLSNIWNIEPNSSANTKKAAVNAISLENNLEEKGETRFCF